MQLGIWGHLVTVYRHWFKIVLVIAGAVMMTGAIAFLSSKVYVSETRVLILSRSPAARATSSNFTEQPQAASPQEQALTQVAILKSPLLAMRLAEELGPERVVDEMRWRWDWLRAMPSKWKDQTILALYNWNVTKDLIVNSGINIPDNTPGTPSVEDAAVLLAKNLYADAVLKTDMFAAAFSSPSPAFSAEVLNRLIEIYSDHVVALGRPVRTAQIAQTEVNRLKNELRDRETELRAYSEQNRILSLEKQKDLLLDQRAEVETNLANARRDQLESSQKIAAVREQISLLPTDQAISVTTVANPLVDRLKERLAQMETEVRQFVPGSVSANRVQIEIDGIRNQLATAESAVRGSETIGTSGLYQQLQATLTQELAEQKSKEVRVNFISDQLNKVESELRRLDDLELRYVEMRRMIDAKEDAYRYALQKQEETAITSQLSQSRSLSQVVQVEPAIEPTRPSAPRRGRLLVLGAVVGSMFGIFLAYLLEFARRTMITRRETEIALDLPVLVSQQMSGLIRRRTRANRTEIRGYTSRLQRELKPGQSHKLMFISGERQTGQTTVISAITDVLASQDLKTLTVQFKLSSRVDGEPAIQVKGADGKSARDPGEYTAKDATMPRRDSAVISAPAGKTRSTLSELIRTRGKMYDVILIDAPDLKRFPEALALSPLVDSVLPVVMAARSRVPGVLDLVDQFQEVEANVPGVVLTKLRHSQSSWAFCWMSMMRLKSAKQFNNHALETAI